MRTWSLIVVWLLVGVSAARAQDTTGVGTIVGTVVNADGSPGAGSRVCALGTSSCATADAEGRFRLADLRAASYQLEIIGAQGLPIVSDPIAVRAGVDGTVDVTLPALEQVEQRITVTAPAFAVPDEVKTSGFLVQPREVLKSAGALQDISRYVQTLPGVALGTSDFRNDLIVRGGSPLENLFVVDNVEIPNINAFANFASAGGTVSLLDAELIEDVTFLTGGYPAPYVNRTSSVLQVAQREGSRERYRGWATLGFAGAGAIVEGPIDAGRGSWIVSARRSFLDLFSQDIGVGGVPVLYTVNAKAVYDISTSDRVWAVNIGGVDRIRLGLTEGSPLDDELFNFDIRYRGWRSASGVNWQRILGQRGVALFGVTHAEARVRQQVKDLVRNGPPPAGLPVDRLIADSPIVFRDDSREGETTVKYDLTLAVPFFEKVQAGGSVKRFAVRYDTTAPFGTDNPFAATGDQNAFDLRTSFAAVQAGAYLQATRGVGERASVTLGGRVDDYRYLGERRLSPRAAFSYRLTSALSARAAYGRYFQQPFLLFVAAFPENRRLSPWRADHYVAGLSWETGNSVRVTVEGYRKVYDDYPVAREYPMLSLANIGDTFNVREILFPLTSGGRGRSHGLELFVEKRLRARAYGQANVAVSRTRHAGLDGVLRPGSFDYPVVANAVGGYVLSPRWEVSSRLSYLSGRPYTPFDAAASSAQRRAVYDLAQVNAVRARDYFRLDLRVDRTFDAWGESFVLFGGVQNVTNRKNFGGVQWNRRLNAAQVEEQDGVFPVLGVEWKF